MSGSRATPCGGHAAILPSVATTDSRGILKMAATAAIQIGELSRRTSCNIETIRYYERIGLLPVPPRRGRYRSYGRADGARLGFGRRAREMGFTLRSEARRAGTECVNTGRYMW